MIIQRKDGRNFNELRPLSIVYNIYEYSDGSVLFQIGKTKVLCSVTLTTGVPAFLKGTSRGWLTAEYSMLPAATLNRNSRETTLKANSRNIEISRFIGRSLRASVNLNPLSEKTIHIDCDVLQADGGTRTASITGAFVALKMANEKWLNNGIINSSIIVDDLAAVSIGILNGTSLLDLNYEEDFNAQADCNFVLTKSGNIIEIQANSEKSFMTWQQFDIMRELSIKGVNDIFNFLDISYKVKQSDANISSKFI